jgi:hypothetical protein
VYVFQGHALVGSFMQVLDMDASGISVGERINNFSRRIYRLQRAEGDVYVDKRSISDDFLVLRGCLRHGGKRTLGDLERREHSRHPQSSHVAPML